MKEIEVVDDPEKIKILIEETRSKILRLLRFRDMTISELASILNKDVSTVFRHVKKLESAGFVRVTGERKVHNVPERIYGRTAKTLILAPETYTKDSVIRAMTKRKLKTMVEALRSMGYRVEDEDALIDLVVKMDELCIEDMEKLEKDLDWGILRELKLIITLLKIKEEDVEKLKNLVKRG